MNRMCLLAVTIAGLCSQAQAQPFLCDMKGGGFVAPRMPLHFEPTAGRVLAFDAIIALVHGAPRRARR